MKITESKIYRILSIIPILAVMAIIFYLSAQCGEESAETSGGLLDFILSLFFKDTLLNETISDFVHEFMRSLAHFAEYALLGLLMYNAVNAFSIKRAPVVSVALSFTYALSDEIHQYFVPERSFQLIDLAVDLGGIILGTVVIFLLFKLINRISLKNKKENAL